MLKKRHMMDIKRHVELFVSVDVEGLVCVGFDITAI